MTEWPRSLERLAQQLGLVDFPRPPPAFQSDDTLGASPAVS